MKLIIKIIIIVFIFFLGFYVGQNQAKAPGLDWAKFIQPPVNQEKTVVDSQPSVKVNLMFDFGNGQVQTFDQVNLIKDTTAFDLLKKVTGDNKIEFKTKDYGGDLGQLIESINNVANNNKTNQFWHYWVNGIYAETGASNYHLKNGDVVEFKYVSNQFNLIKH